MPLSALSDREREIVHRCLRVVADDETFFADDGEFQTIFGLTRHEFIQIANRWPELDERIADVTVAIGNARNNLLGYPHGRHESWGRYFAFTQE